MIMVSFQPSSFQLPASRFSSQLSALSSQFSVLSSQRVAGSVAGSSFLLSILSFNLPGECLRSLERTDDRRNSGLSRQARAAVDGGDGKVQLRAARLARQRDADRVEERLALLPRPLLHTAAAARKVSRSSGPASASSSGSAAITDRAPVSCRTPATSARASAAAGSNSNRNSSRSGISSSRSTDPPPSAAPRSDTPSPRRSVDECTRAREVARTLRREPRRRGGLHVVAVHPRRASRGRRCRRCGRRPRARTAAPARRSAAAPPVRLPGDQPISAR